jgi:hypothetical protein
VKARWTGEEERRAEKAGTPAAHRAAAQAAAQVWAACESSQQASLAAEVKWTHVQNQIDKVFEQTMRSLLHVLANEPEDC